MKKNKLVKLLFAFCLLTLAVSCAEEIGEEREPKGTGVDFLTVSSSYKEIDGTGTVTIPFRNGSFSESDITFTGDATEGEDYEFVGITDEGIQISIIDDNDFEPIEFVKVVVGTSGNNVHTISIVSNCQDTQNPYDWYFRGTWAATEFYCGLGVTTGSCDFGPYNVTLVQDSEDPTKYTFTNFYGTTGLSATIVFDMANGTVAFPDQDAGGDTTDPEITASTGTFTIDDCTSPKGTKLIINLNYDGGDWIYQFKKL
jgi:hypothetical protein